MAGYNVKHILCNYAGYDLQIVAVFFHENHTSICSMPHLYCTKCVYFLTNANETFVRYMGTCIAYEDLHAMNYFIVVFILLVFPGSIDRGHTALCMRHEDLHEPNLGIA